MAKFDNGSSYEITFKGKFIGTYDLEKSLNEKVEELVLQQFGNSVYKGQTTEKTEGIAVPTPPPHQGGITQLFILDFHGTPVYAGLLGTHREPWETWMRTAHDVLKLKNTVLMGYRIFTLFNGCDPYQVQKYGTIYCPQEELNLFKTCVYKHEDKSMQEFWFTTAADALDFHERVVRILNG